MSKAHKAEELWERAQRRLPQVSAEEQRVAIVLLHELAKGEPVSLAQLARALGTTTAAVQALVTASALRPFIHLDEQGRIQGAYGLSVTPTHHRITLKGRRLWAWCAPDTLEYAELLQETVEIESPDPETGEAVRLTVSPERIEAVVPTGVWVSLRRPETWDTTSAPTIITSACHFHFFFSSRASGERWVAKHPDTFLLPLDEMYAFMRRCNQHMFGAELARRRARA